MKISKRDAQLLIILGGLLVFLALYMLVFNHFQAKADAVAQNIATLTPQLQELENEYANLATYQNGIAEYRNTVAKKLGAFPADIKEEDVMSYLMTMEAQNGIKLDEITFSGTTPLNEFQGVVQKDGKDVPVTMDVFSVGAVATGQMNYSQLKSVIDYLYPGPTQSSLNSVSVSFNSETGGLTGSLDINRYYITYDGANYVPEPLPDTALGTQDPFNTAKAASATEANG